MWGLRLARSHSSGLPLPVAAAAIPVHTAGLDISISLSLKVIVLSGPRQLSSQALHHTRTLPSLPLMVMSRLVLSWLLLLLLGQLICQALHHIQMCLGLP